MNYNMTDKENIIHAKELIDNNFFTEAIIVLDDISDNNNDKIIETKQLFLAVCCYNLKLYDKSIFYAEKVLKNNPSYELASLNKYLSHVAMQDFNAAFLEIIDFLKFNRAVLYKVTLEELLDDIESGHINDPDLINGIKILADENNVR